MSGNKALIKKAELELSQKLQMHFPWGALTDEQIKVCNEAPKDVVSALVFEMVNMLSKVDKKLLSSMLRIIETDPHPLIPKDLKAIVEHKKMGQITFDPSKLSLYLSKKQQSGRIEGNELRKELEGKPVMNANVLDYLLAHTELIPEEWKGKVVFFWGTIYRNLGGDLYVRCLGWVGDRWFSGCRWLGGDWVDSAPALLCASV